MIIHRVILTDGAERSAIEIEELRVLFESRSVTADSLVQQEDGGKWSPLRAIVALSEWERDAHRYSVICADGTEHGAIGISRLRQIYKAGDIQSSSPVLDSGDNRWLPLGDRFNTGTWPQPAGADAGTKFGREPEERATAEEDSIPTAAPAANSDPVVQQESHPDLKPALQAIEEDGRRKYWASWLLFASSAFELAWYVLAKAEGFLLLNEGMTTGTLLWNVIVAFGLRRGGDGWRRFACIRAGLGLLLGFGYAVEGRYGIYYGWLNALWCIGFLVLLSGKSATSRRRIIGTTLVAGGQLAVFANLLVATVLPEYRVRWQIQAHSVPTSKVSDANLGYTIDIPSGWTVLKKDNPILKLPDAKMIAVNVRNGAFVAFLAEPAFAALRSPDDYLDQVEKSFKAGTSNQFRELRRIDAVIDGTTGRRAEAQWQESGEEYYGVFVAVRRGWFYYSLRGWSVKAFRSKAENSFLEMQGAVKISADPSEKFTDGFLKGLQANNPLISEQTGRRLVEAAIARNYTMMDVRQLIENAVEKGRPGLTRGEQGELDALYARAFTTLPDTEYRTLLSYYDRLNAGQKTEPIEAQNAEKLVLKGVRNLPESVRVRFQVIFSKMVEQGLARID